MTDAERMDSTASTQIWRQYADTIADERRRVSVPVSLLRYIVNSHPSLSVDDRIAASRWLDTVKVVK